jgi:hypothetical protein
MLEQVPGLGIDFERVLLIEQARIEVLTVHPVTVLQTTTQSDNRARLRFLPGWTRRRDSNEDAIAAPRP